MHTGLDSDFAVQGISFDSKNVSNDYLFICKGAAFKAEYLKEAIANGASAYISENKYEDIDPSIPALIVSDIRRAMTLVALWFYDNPSEKLDVIAFTATKGKTTATHMTKQTLDSWVGNAGLISTIEMFDGRETEESFNTTPESPDLQRWLKRMVDNDVNKCVLEVSSQGLRYGRVDGTHLKVASFMNIARDHISPIEHKDFEDYFTAKLMIFEQAEIGIVNLDMDSNYVERVLDASMKHCKTTLTYSLQDDSADFYGYDLKKNDKYTTFRLKSSYADTSDELFEISMHGRFNVSNALAVIASCLVVGEPLDLIKEGLRDARVDGRMEVFTSKDNNIVAIVDYAHNKLSYESLFSAMKEDYPEHAKNIRVIFGSVGEKAFERREELGTVAGRCAKFSYISADYPGKEPFEKIASEIAHFVELQGGDYKIIEDRNVAIEEAISTAEGPTIVMALGFGRLKWQKYADGYVPRESDVECVERCLAEYDKKHSQ